MNVPISINNKKFIRNELSKTFYMEPSFKKHIDKMLDCETYQDLSKLIISIIRSSKPSCIYAGTKEAYFDDFKSWLDQNHRHSKYIHLIRNPLSVLASVNTGHTKYPVIYIAHYWRKHIAYALSNYHKDNIPIIKYEDLCMYPKKSLSFICKYLNIEFESEMLKRNGWKQLSGKKWASNSNFKYKGKDDFYLDSIDMWRNEISDIDFELLTNICYEEMKVFYPELLSKKKGTLHKKYFINKSTLTTTDRKCTPNLFNNKSYNKKHIENIWRFEVLRNKYLISKKKLSSTLINKYFIDKYCYDTLQKNACTSNKKYSLKHNLCGIDLDLVKLDKKYLDDMWEYSSDPRLYKYFEFDCHQTKAETEKYYKQLTKRSNEITAKWWFIKPRNSDKVIGTIGVHDIDLTKSVCEISYALSPMYWGKGYFNRSLRILLNELFFRSGMKAIEVVTAEDNIRSVNALKKVGFKTVKILKNYYCKNKNEKFNAMKLKLSKESYI
tara:strand:- start:1193 stop:2677 length:1485 start_codon:yes stop_codon:yes gene_type:complete